MSANKRAAPQRYAVSGVCCASEEGVLRKNLDAAIGPDCYAFNLVTAELTVNPDVAERDVVASIRRAGFDARNRRAPAERPSFWRRHAEAVTAAGALLLLLGAITGERLGAPAFAVRALLLAAIAGGGWRIAIKAFKALRSGTLDMNVLMSVAVIGALAIDRWAEGAAVIVLFSVSLMLESYSTLRTRRAVQSLMTLSPEEASVVRGGHETIVPVGEVSPGDMILIRPGGRVPLDGVVTAGSSDVSEAMITGEAVPVLRAEGDPVFAGTFNGRGSLTVRVTRRSEDTTLARILHLIEEAQQQRAPVQNFIDRFAGRYTLAVLVGAAIVAAFPPLFFQQPFVPWLYRALVLLVIACPCALVISTPVTIVSALTGAARRGMLIKGGRYLEALAKVRAMAFDKTGTLTEGRPRVTDFVALDSMPRAEALRIAAAMEYRSEHHLASAVLAEAAIEGIEYGGARIDQFEAIPGKGVTASIDGDAYYLGNRALCEERGYCSGSVRTVMERLESEGKTVVVLGRGSEALCAIGISDTIRLQSRDALDRLRGLGVETLVMLSGDHAASVDRMAGELGVSDRASGLLPADKVEAVKELQRKHGIVAMVGDGINDAPALAASSVGIAMGVSGTDAALETADVVLMSDDLSNLPRLLSLSRRTMAIVRQNIALALALKALFLILTIAGVATLWMAVLADDGAALLVIFNGLRALSPAGIRDK